MCDSGLAAPVRLAAIRPISQNVNGDCEREKGNSPDRQISREYSSIHAL